VLTVVEMLRKKGVVGKFVEFYGAGLDTLSLEDRATIANMAPEYGATCGFFPVDNETLDYLRATGRDEDRVQLVEQYSKAQGMFRPERKDETGLHRHAGAGPGHVVPSLAGPKRPQDRVALSKASQLTPSPMSSRTSSRRLMKPPSASMSKAKTSRSVMAMW
jgi:aconitate hydratase